MLGQIVRKGEVRCMACVNFDDPFRPKIIGHAWFDNRNGEGDVRVLSITIGDQTGYAIDVTD